MVNNDIVASALSKINNAEKANKMECTIKIVSKMLKSIFDIMRDNGYIAGYEEFASDRGNYIKVTLNHSINQCGAIKPRFHIGLNEFISFEKRFLPAKDFGLLIISTNKGLMTHYDARKQDRGGAVIAYVY